MTEESGPQTGEQAAFMHDLYELLARHKPVGGAVATYFPPSDDVDDTVLAVFGLPNGDAEAQRTRALYTLARMMEVLEERGRQLADRLVDMDTPIIDGASRVIRSSESPGGLQ